MEHDFTSYIKQFKKGDVIFKEEDASFEMYFVHSGEVRIEKQIGDKLELIAILQKGDFFGEMSLIDHVPRSATATAHTDVDLLEVNGENFTKILEGNIEIALRIIRKYIARLREANERLSDSLRNKNEMDREIQEIVKTPAKEIVKQVKPIAVLEHNAGRFFIYEGENTIGRHDPVTGETPQVDLTDIDPQKTTSRKHARIRVSSGAFEIFEELGVKNGTYVNGIKISQATYIPIEPGNQIQIGKIAFELKQP